MHHEEQEGGQQEVVDRSGRLGGAVEQDVRVEEVAELDTSRSHVLVALLQHHALRVGVIPVLLAPLSLQHVSHRLSGHRSQQEGRGQVQEDPDAVQPPGVVQDHPGQPQHDGGLVEDDPGVGIVHEHALDQTFVSVDRGGQFHPVGKVESGRGQQERPDQDGHQVGQEQTGWMGRHCLFGNRRSAVTGIL